MIHDDDSLYVGLMSGTSADGIDAVVVKFNKTVQLIDKIFLPYPDQLRSQLLALNETGQAPMSSVCHLDKLLGHAFATSVSILLESAGLQATDITAIGCHGHTALHRPEAESPFTLQIGCGATIAVRTGITTICDFRSTDIAAGGQGAPLVPAFHRHWFGQQNKNTAILNIGGIANLTLFSDNGKEILGFDTGPGNALMDEWCFQHTGQRFDKGGQWAQSGTPNAELLEKLLSHRYFKQAPPKSTGRDVFNLALVEQYREQISKTISNEDIQATLCELTAKSISEALNTANHRAAEVFVCGGGAHNTYLMERLSEQIGGSLVYTTGKLGIDPDWVEAIAFAWFAKYRTLETPVDMTSITGAKSPIILGAAYLPVPTT